MTEPHTIVPETRGVATPLAERLRRVRIEDDERRAAGKPTLLTIDEIRDECRRALSELIGEGKPTTRVQRAASRVARRELTVRFSGRFTRRMGDADSSINRVRFSRPLWGRAAYAERLDTVRHEIAHLVANELSPRAGHGPLWVEVAAALGCSTRRCHSVPRKDLERRRAGSVFVVCGCPGVRHSLGARRAALLRRGVSKIVCRSCSEQVRLDG